jgi:hypothetical protein
MDIVDELRGWAGIPSTAADRQMILAADAAEQRRREASEGCVMEFVRRAKYGPNHSRAHEMHNTVHVLVGDKTACGKETSEMWFVCAADAATCRRCLAKIMRRTA